MNWWLIARKAAVSALPVAAAIAVAPICAPQLLAFPYHAKAGASEVWSEQPLDPTALARMMARRDALISASPIARMPENRHTFLTQGGWRWLWLANSNWDGFGLTRAFNEAVIVNHSDLSADRVFANRIHPELGVGGVRTLSGVLAHETCHGMERRHFGFTVQFIARQEIFEGYCDYLAQESTLSESDVAKLTVEHRDHPALPYYYGRRRVAAILAANGGDVDALFDGAN